MLSSVLNSDRAVLVNIEIMRAFVRLRESVSKHKDLAAKLTEPENRYDRQRKLSHRSVAPANIVLPAETACSAMRKAAAFQDCPGIPRGASVFP
jgi:hypothetical protein